MLAVDSVDERNEWVKILQMKLDNINANAPITGWLEKRKGRGGGAAC